MRRIEKKSIEPKELTAYRNEQLKSPEGKLEINFYNLPSDVKKALKLSLLEEQGHLCCYCMQRIETDEMKVEHFFTQAKSKKSANPKEKEAVVNYNNLLASCEGNKDIKGREKHCDSCRDGSNLSFENPASKDFNLKIEYAERQSEGKILIKESIFEKELTCNSKSTCLNLNEEFLAKKRYNVWKGVQNILFKESKQAE